MTQHAAYVLAFDTANEVIALGLGRLVAEASTSRVEVVTAKKIPAHRASNTRLLPEIDTLLEEAGILRSELACICVGRGPGSFTGVRIAMATAKGIASALRIGLVGVSTTDAVAYGCQAAGYRGSLLVCADAMRKEIYPMSYELADDGISRTGVTADRVMKVALAAEELASEEACYLCGDGLLKYEAELALLAEEVLPEELWTPSGEGLLMALEALWQARECNPLDALRHHPAFTLPVYTRLSDAEEAERARIADGATAPKNLITGVQGGLELRPLALADVAAAVALDGACLPQDVWSEASLADELGRKDRLWWVASQVAPGRTGQSAAAGAEIIGLAGGMVIEGDVQILKVAVSPEYRRRGIAAELLARLADDARNLACSSASLEVRASNGQAQAFYKALGFEPLGPRPRFYEDGEDALIMEASLDELLRRAGQKAKGAGQIAVATRSEAVVAGSVGQSSGSSGQVAASGELTDEVASEAVGGLASPQLLEPLILAVESSCDETAAAVISRDGTLRSDIVASQIDFHARFGGVVPEIASRKHIEAICGVFDEALETAGLEPQDLTAVAATYAPGLVGALVVGVAFAKGVAWALDVPFIGVNHLEGHLYANKLAQVDFQPPAVVSLVSGGNTMLVHMKDWGSYEVLGSTIDDAVGEAFDKVAKALGLGYPGGPVISKLAAEGKADAIDFPRAMLHSHDLDFSLSGLKTAVITHIMKVRDNQGEEALEAQAPDICASFQQAVIDVQVAKAATALKETGAQSFCLGGGVAANPALRKAYQRMCKKLGVNLVMAPLKSCGDNAGMIALVALDRYKQQKFFSLDADAHANADLGAAY